MKVNPFDAFADFEVYGGKKFNYVHPSTSDRDKQLKLNPHYTEKLFNKPQTVFGKEEKGLEYVYSDRLWQWDYAKAQSAGEIANTSGTTRHSANWVQKYLEAYYDRPVYVGHILSGVNVSNGYPYWVVGFKFTGK